LAAPLEGLKLHLGCGKRFIPGFLHIDQGDFPHLDYISDVGSLGMFKNGTVDLIYASHVFEYFDRIEAIRVLGEWRRVLKLGGVLRLAVPDFQKLVEVYMKYGDFSLIHGPLYGRIEVKTPSGVIVKYHRTCYDFQSLRNLLRESGFSDVRPWDWRLTEHAEYDDYSQAYIPHMNKKNGILISLNVEATKSGDLA